MGPDHEQRLQEFLNSEFSWNFSAGECNFLIQLLAHLVQDNPAFIRGAQGEKEQLNYQSIRLCVLLNEKLSSQFQRRSKEAAVVTGESRGPTGRVQ